MGRDGNRTHVTDAEWLSQPSDRLSVRVPSGRALPPAIKVPPRLTAASVVVARSSARRAVSNVKVENVVNARRRGSQHEARLRPKSVVQREPGDDSQGQGAADVDHERAPRKCTLHTVTDQGVQRVASDGSHDGGHS